ncbi:MAG: ammonia-forming cytochrome c nitrite reductase subunit c552 [Chlorobi bacterium]|nr:ammonia-forming cytochrome c nitrite reductase subunit c552 [Chlorobiota bacterium]
MMNKLFYFILIIILSACNTRDSKNSQTASYSGSESCIECHERFYNLWSPSHHGKAMQATNKSFIKENALPESGDFALEGKKYEVILDDSTLVLLEKEGAETTRYDIDWALGGKNVYYFLTPMEKGKLQTIPLAYNINKQEWYNNPESAIRHFPDADTPDEALSWKDRMYTFNTSCYGCHVSQLTTNFDLTSDSYRTTWRESGINCETCHGPSSEHVKLFKKIKNGKVPYDIKLVVTKRFTPEQHNSACAPCHAKMQPITASYMPGKLFYNHYNLTTLENPDFYPDGRDLGENYTMTTWGMNACVSKSDLHCVICHTSSGRFRFKGENSNDACKSCHESRVNDVVAHSHHPEGSEGALCINCHMPKTEFGNMIRSDHSFRPPMPGATLKFGSPNACNICHNKKSAEWAVKKVNEWYPDDAYRKETIRWAQLIKEAREDNWANLDKMLEIINGQEHNEIITTSLIRLLANCRDQEKWKVIIDALGNNSPLVRSAAAAGLMGNFTEEARTALLKACSDTFRVVRVSAALPLSAFPDEQFSTEEQAIIAKATTEYKQSLVSRPDDWSAHYNMGIFYQNRGDIVKALESYETSTRLYPAAIMPLVNSSVLYSYIGNPAKAEENLRKALKYAPDDEAVNLNLGLLLAEQGRNEEAKKALETCLKSNPNQGIAAYNLSILYAGSDINKALKYAKMATAAIPEDPKYSYTLAYYQSKAKLAKESIKTLKGIIKKYPGHLNSVFLLAQIYVQAGQKEKAKQLYMKTLKAEGLSDAEKAGVQQALAGLSK